MSRLTRALIMLAAVLICATVAVGQSASVSGQVLDREGKPWPDITVVLKSDNGRTFTLKTDKDGKFAQLGLPSGAYKVTLTSATETSLNYTETHQFSSDQDNNVLINFKELIAKAGKTGPSDADVKAQQDQQNKFKDMQSHFTAGRAALDDWDATHKKMLALPADQRAPLQDQLSTDSKTAIAELQLAEQGVQQKDVKNHAIVWSNLAQAYDRAGQPQEAADAYQKAIDLQPNASFYQSRSTALANVAVSQTDPQVAQQKIADASADCDKAAALDPTPTAATICWKNMGIVLTNKGDFKDAAPALVKATTLSPKDAQAWYLLGGAYTGLIVPNQQGDKMTYEIPPGTAEAYQKVIDLDPNGPYAELSKQSLDALTAMGGGDALSLGTRKKTQKKQ
jgi:tetratricopeptide (TPR) repeat protein